MKQGIRHGSVSRFAIAPLLFVAGQASAQSAIVLYGTVDVNGRYVKNSGSDRRLSEGTGGLNTTQLGFRGAEDLGNGMKAVFTLLSGILPDVGTTNNAAKFFDRRATIGLLSPFGEIRLGRDYVPSYWNNLAFDPFGAVSIGAAFNMSRDYVGTVVPGPRGGTVAAVNSYVRTDNTLGYLLPPDLGGLYGQAMVSAGEGGGSSLGRYMGARLGYAVGAIDVAAAYGQTRADAVAGGPKFKTSNVGASYDFKLLKLMASFHNDVNEISTVRVHEKRWWIGTVVPFGTSEVHASFVRTTANPGPSANQLALGYVYNLSKRTALYSTLSRIQNGGDTATGGSFSVATLAGGSITALPTRGGESKGAEFGIRHFF